MRYVAALLYVLLELARLSLGRQVTDSYVQQLQSRWRGRQSLRGSVLSAVIVGLAFLQYFILTGVFPLGLVLILMAATVVVHLVMLVARAALGIDTPERLSKGEALQFLWGIVSGRIAGMAVIVFTGVLLAWPLLVLTIYLVLPDSDDPSNSILLALVHFCAPALLWACFHSAIIWQNLSSHFVDDDVRSHGFIDLVRSTLLTLVYVLYPAYLVLANNYISPYSRYVWLLFLLPALILTVGGVVPLIIGSLRYRIERSDQLDWKRKWLSRAETSLKEGPEVQSTAVIWKELDDQIDEKFASSGLLRLLKGGVEASSPAQGAPVEQPSANEDAIVRNHIMLLDRALRGAPFYIRELPVLAGWTQPRAISDDEIGPESLLRWDFTSRYLNNLLSLRRTSIEEDKTTIIKRLAAENAALGIENTAAASSDKRNVFAGLLLTGLGAGVSAVVSLVFKAYETTIVGYIHQIVGP